MLSDESIIQIESTCFEVLQKCLMRTDQIRMIVYHKAKLLDFTSMICYNTPVKCGNTLATQSQIAHPKRWNRSNVDNVS